MKIGIVGSGAMGSIFAYYFHEAGIDTIIYENDMNTISSMKNGLYIIKGDKNIKIPVNIEDSPAALQNCDHIFLFVKSYSTLDAVKKIAKQIRNNSIIVTLQNGLGNYEIISKYIPEKRIVYGSTSVGATKKNLNTVVFGGAGKNIIGGNDDKAVQSIFSLFKKSNLDVEISPEPDKAIWNKAIINAGINPIGSILGIPNGEIIKNEFALKLQEKIIREAVSVAESMGYSFDANEMINLVKQVCKNTSCNLCSMLQDTKNNRLTEIDSITGKIIEYGKKNRIETPFNEAMYYLTKSKELYIS